ncbi:MAG: hypothetical protein JW702_07380 [Clostridiales bacterium]|nr:hypothetical protein [Clostridiales bacterium]
MSYDIKIEQPNKRFGFIEGSISHYSFYAEIQKETVADGLDLSTLQKGEGKITKLCIFKDEIENSGNPFLPTMSIKRHIYINFENEWKVYNFTFYNIMFELVQYLDRRCQMSIVR